MIEILMSEIHLLVAYADAQEKEMSNSLGAAGVRYAASRMERALTNAMERLVEPDEASAYSGYSKRQLRRVAKNYGKPGAPLYRLGELRPKHGLQVVEKEVSAT